MSSPQQPQGYPPQEQPQGYASPQGYAPPQGYGPPQPQAPPPAAAPQPQPYGGGPTGELVLTLQKPFGAMGMISPVVSIDGYPAAAAYFAMTVETLGGLALITGFYARVTALLQLPILLGAALVHLANGWMFSSPNGGFEFPLFWAAALLAVVLIGPGAYALRDVAAPTGPAPDLPYGPDQ